MEIVETKYNKGIVLNLGARVVTRDGQDFSDGKFSLDRSQAAVFFESIDRVVAEGFGSIVVNMEQVNDFDSDGLQLLVDASRKVKSSNRDMILINANKNLKTVMDITKISHKLTVYQEKVV